jgi:aldehyde:ferredoxin oxidoreductase
MKLSDRMLELDLSTRGVKPLQLSLDEMRKYIGGASLAAYLLFDQLTPGLKPLSPQAPLAFVSGPLTGTHGPAVGRAVVCAKSPATNAWGESNIGGHLGRQLRSAGVDALIITGRASEPVYLWIHDGEVEIRPAGHLWGKSDCYEAQDRIRAELDSPAAHIASIGRAGEVQIPYALILCDHGRVAGRTGMGAVMGSKNLKAIAVHGTQPIPIAAPERFSALRSSTNRALRDDVVSKGMRDFGTASAGDMLDYFGMMPKRYFTRGTIEDVDRISGPTMSETILSGVSTCHGCVIACGRKVRLANGKERKGPEYETLIGFGPNLGSTDMEAITRIGELCDRYGMDTISLSNSIGLAFLLYERGMLDEKACGGPLEWGDVEAVERLVHATVARDGFGAILADGALALARACEAEELAAQVKGLEAAFHDPRGATGVGLSYATSPRGACHNQSHYYLVEIGQTMEDIGVELMSRHAGAEKARNVARHQDWLTVLNSLVQCIFANVPHEVVCELLNLATGWGYSLPELLESGERGWNLKRLINARLGFSAADDTLPEHMLQPLPDGESAGFRPPFEEMIQAYYRERGWDPETGAPDHETLQRLGLNELSLEAGD